MLGKAFKNIVPDAHYLSSRDCDLGDTKQVDKLFSITRPKTVIHLASRVGGVKANMEHLGEFYLDNILMNTNVLEASRKYKVEKVLSCLSTCVYPDKVNYPLTEDQIHNGPPHPSNYTYSYTKRMLDIQSQAYRDQYGCNFISMAPNNLFGENDNFDLENSHVVPALIRKIYEAKTRGTNVVLWGDGSALREFTYVGDIPAIAILLLEKYNERGPINVGSTGEKSIKEVVELIAEYFNFKGDLEWDTTKPNGQFRKPSDKSKLSLLGWKEENYTNFKEAIEKTCSWFEESYPDVRGVK